MDGIAEHLQQKLERIFSEAKDVAIETVLTGWDRKTPLHFSQIEAAAHQLAARWSCCIQEWAAREMTAEAPDSAACPTCGEMCALELAARTILSTDGPVPIVEWKGTCTRCRRDFFPSTGSDGVGQPGTDAGDDAENRTCRGRYSLQQTRSGGAEERRRQRSLTKHRAAGDAPSGHGTGSVAR